MLPEKGKHERTPEDKTAAMIYDAWREYTRLFGEPVHGTIQQIRAALCLGGGKDVVRAVNAHKALVSFVKGYLDDTTDFDTLDRMAKAALKKAEAPHDA